MNMSRRDAESFALEKWLQQLGYLSHLRPEEIRRLLSPNMRSVWCHLQTYVKPVRSVQTIHKNLLLAKLRKDNIQLRNFKIQSCDELILVERVSETQKEIDSKNAERKAVDDEINSLVSKIAENRYNIISKTNEVREFEEKSTLLNLKLAQIQKEVGKLDEDNSKASILEMVKPSEASREEMSTVVNIATFLMKSKLTLPFESISKEEKEVLLNFTKEHSVKTIYQAFLLASDSVSKSLKHFFAHLDSPEDDVEDTSTFLNHLKYLNVLVVDNLGNIHDFLESIKASSAILDTKKKELLNIMKLKGKNSNISIDGDEDSIIETEELVEKFVNRSISAKKEANLKEFIDKLEEESFEYEHLKLLSENNRKKEDEWNKEVKMKVDLINILYSKIYMYNSKVDHVKNEISNKCNEPISTLCEMLKNKDLNEMVLLFEQMMVNEIKIFHDASLSALTRRWENVNELLPKELLEELSSYPELRLFLLQSEPKNILKSVLEKKWWSFCLVERKRQYI